MAAPLMSVIVCAHNEEACVNKCLPSLVRALDPFVNEIIFVADRCTDKTMEKAKKYPVKVINKTWSNWENSYAESLQTAYIRAKGSHIGIIDVDIVVPSNFFKDLLPKVEGNIASVAAEVITYPDTLWNRIMYAWERTYALAPLGREPYGAARIILKKALDEITGFRDVPTPDTDIDFRLSKRGYRSVSVSTVKVFHMRHISFRTAVNGQMTCGRGRYVLGISLTRTIGHSIFRLRPFLIGGWLLEWQRSHNMDNG